MNSNPPAITRKLRVIASLAVAAIAIAAVSCEKPATPPPAGTTPDASSADMPVLPLKADDTWRYSVQVEIPAGVTGPDAPEVKLNSEVIRRYIGKVKPAADLPEVDCFEVSAPNSHTEREFVEITDRMILMRGSIVLHPDITAPSWLEPGVPFVFAGMKAGAALREVRAGSDRHVRNLQAVAREEVTVPAGTFPAIRLLMTGTDDEVELRRTIWFAFGTGIVREEKLRYGSGKLLVRETRELVETTVPPKANH